MHVMILKRMVHPVCVYVKLEKPYLRDIPPGLLQHVLTVLVFWSWVLLLPRLPPWSRSLRLFPWLAFCFTGPWTLLGSAARSSPTTHAKTGRTAHAFTAQGGGDTPITTTSKRQSTSAMCIQPAIVPSASRQVSAALRSEMNLQLLRVHHHECSRHHCQWQNCRDILPLHLAGQCEIPPHIAQYPVEIVSQRGVSHPFALFS